MVSLKMKYLSRLRYLNPIFINKNVNVFHRRVLLHTSASLNAEGLPIKMPSLSPTMIEGTIVKWLKKEGETIESGDVLCDIQTDKAVMSLETDEEGILAKILVAEDIKDIKVGTMIALMVDEGEDWKDVQMPVDDSEGADLEKTEANAEETKAEHEIENFGPSVRLLLEKFGLTSDQVPPSGPHEILTKGDVLKYVEEKHLQPKPLEKVPPPEAPIPLAATQSAPAVASTLPPVVAPPVTPNVMPSADYIDIEVTSMRRTIAKRLLHSKTTIAHAYCTVECCLDEMLRMRKEFKANDVSVSVNDFIIKAAAAALIRCPQVNCVWENGQLSLKSFADVSVAVATPAGLITPIVRGAHARGLTDIAATVRDLAGRAKKNALKLDEFQGGTFTISNLGMFGITEFSAIINPPQCAIMAVGGGRVELNEEGKPEQRMCATLSYDAKAISEDDAAIFMSTFQQLIEDPQTIILGSVNTRPKVDHPLAALL